MAKPNENEPDIDLDEDIIPDDDLTAALRESLDKIEAADDGDDEDDSGGFDAPLEDTPSREVMNEEEGNDAISAARDGAKFKTAKPKADDKPEPEPKAEDVDKTKADDPAKPAEKEEPKTDDPDDTKDGADDAKDAEPLSDEAYDAEIGALSAGAQERIKSANTQYNEFTAPFKGRDDLKGFGDSPAAIAKSLVEINDYAARDPADYIAWATTQTAGNDANKIKDVITKAAEKLGFDVVPKSEPKADDLDDPFISDRERELLQQVSDLKKNAGPAANPITGPNSPANDMRNMALDFIGESGADGKPLRPDYELLHADITRQIQDRAAKGEAITKAVLAEAYDKAEMYHPQTRDKAVQRLVDARNSAKPPVDVPKQGNENAAKVEKARNASTKLIDGPGHGAHRQPAIGADDSIESTLKKLWPD